MKALVLCGGVPQVQLVKELKERGIYTILADQNEKAPAVALADKFYPVSTLDVDGIRDVAKKENVDFLITVCADQMLLVVAQVSEELGLPCYIDYETAKNVSNKEFMKRIFVENDIPTSKHVVLKELDKKSIEHLEYPIIVKPVDSYSSRGVKRVSSYEELEAAFKEAVDISRTSTAVVEEFVEGREITVDAYIEDGKANVLCISELYKIPGNNKFVIYRSLCPAPVSDKVKELVFGTVQKIANAFNLKDTPLLMQAITNGKDKLSVVEFCARTGGVLKFRQIQTMTGFDVIKAVVDLTLGLKPHVEKTAPPRQLLHEFLYCNPGVLERIEGLEELKEEGVISEFFKLKAPGVEFKEVKSSGDRLASYTVSSMDMDELIKKHQTAAKRIKAIATNGEDLVKHDLCENIKLNLG